MGYVHRYVIYSGSESGGEHFSSGGRGHGAWAQGGAIDAAHFYLRAGQQSLAAPGLLVEVAVQAGQKVQAGERVAVIEAMKMENVLFAVADGVVGKVLAAKGETLTVDQPIVEFA